MERSALVKVLVLHFGFRHPSSGAVEFISFQTKPTHSFNKIY
jgi:hypothetical protein